MAFDDMTAFGAIRALAKAGLRVPEHCSVIGFDDVAACSLYTPPLTTVRQPMEAMGAMAANLVVEGHQCGAGEAGSVGGAPQDGAGIGGAGVHPQPALDRNSSRKASSCARIQKLIGIFSAFFLDTAVELPQYSRY